MQQLKQFVQQVDVLRGAQSASHSIHDRPHFSKQFRAEEQTRRRDDSGVAVKHTSVDLGVHPVRLQMLLKSPGFKLQGFPIRLTCCSLATTIALLKKSLV